MTLDEYIVIAMADLERKRLQAHRDLDRTFDEVRATMQSQLDALRERNQMDAAEH
jgi:hypothetical protein